VTNAAATTDECVDRLREVERKLAEAARRLERERDSRCVFAHAYSLMTRRIVEALPVTAGIDQAWITTLAEAFAARYFAALDPLDEDTAPSRAWRRAFEAMRDRQTSVLEDLVFAMVVHIVRDLPLALGDVSPNRRPEWSHVYDFHAINDMMAGSIDEIQAETSRRYSPYISWLDQLSDRYDEILTNYGVRMSRGLAWYNALRLADERSAEEAKEAIEHSPVVFIEGIVRPPILSLRILLWFLRRIVSLFRVWPGAA
jgi:Family of unknown function (DUF5995)